MAIIEETLLSAEVTDDDGSVRVTLHGELSAATAPALASLLGVLVFDADGTIVIDLRDVDVVRPADDVLLRGWESEPTAPGEWRLRRPPS